MKFSVIFSILLIFSSCQGQTNPSHLEIQKKSIIDTTGLTLKVRINAPSSYKRINVKKNSFADYLRLSSLKPHGSAVMHYDESVKYNPVHIAVFKQDIGRKDLHQCADAIMRLKAEYHWKNKSYDQIHFNFTNGFRVDYTKWMNGNRIQVNGNKTTWKKTKSPSNDYKTFWSYMEMIFMYAGTASLSKELIPITLENIKIGDVFIQGGFPGHAILVVDMAINDKNEKVVLLGQSYMPAQEFHILKNPINDNDSPWYQLSNKNQIITPEWTFNASDLKRFK